MSSSAFQQSLQSLRRATVRTMVGGTVAIGTLEVTTHLPSQGRSSQFYHSLADDWVVPAMRKALPPEWAHQVALKLAVLAPTYRPSAKEQKLNVGVTLWENQTHFHSPIGLAAGYDKDATAIAPLLSMGFSFCEIGSVCLRSQPGNPSPRMFRLTEDEGIINRYGFNSEGAHVVEHNLQQFRELQKASSTTTEEEEMSSWQRVYNLLWPGSNTMLATGMVGVNLGKNKTSETAVEDYQAMIRQLGPYADYIVINVSSPNTPGLRDLQETTSLEGLLSGCQEACRELEKKTPLLVKLSPDLSDDELKDIAKLLTRLDVDGIILTNTTIKRAGLFSPQRKEAGGLSGRPLKNRSTECIRLLYECTKGQIPIIGVGGVQNGSDAYEKLRAGASLIQVYSGMIYKGPGIASKIRDEVAELMIQNGQKNLQEEVVGSAHEQLFWERQRALLEKRNSATPTLIVDKEEKDADEEQTSRGPPPQQHILATEGE